MSRVIDADTLMQDIRNTITEQSSTLDWLNLINRQPTAYDADKVVELLEKNGRKMSEEKSNKPYGKASPGCHNYYKAISVKKAVEIVKGGGVDGLCRENNV